MLLLVSGVVMFLWNTLSRDVLHTTTINYWQALGLLALCRILFSKFSMGNKIWSKPEDTAPNLLKDKLEDMDKDKRSAFKEEWRNRCEQWGKRD
jgi:hypothetical protein